MNVLVSGLNNYVGRRCASLMADDNFKVFAITRNKALFERVVSEPIRAQIIELDLLKNDVNKDIGLRDVDASYYFSQVPRLDDAINLRVELLCLRNFIHLITRLNCNRLVYIAELVDQTRLQPILNLLQEYAVQYTVVLRTVILGKDSLLFRFYQEMSERKIVFYSKKFGGGLLRPLGVQDFIRWLKLILHIPGLYCRVIEVSGGELISGVELYRLYRQLTGRLNVQRIVSLPNWLARLLHRQSGDISAESQSFVFPLHTEEKVDNNWNTHLTFVFTPLTEILVAE